MRTREEILAEMVRVAEALERPGLTEEQISRGRAKYESLSAELDRLEQAQRAEQAAAQQTTAYEPRVQQAIDKIWSILDPEGKRRRKKYG